MRAVQITRFGSPEVLDVVGLADLVPGEDEQLLEVSAVGIKFADTHIGCRPTDLAGHDRATSRRAWPYPALGAVGARP